MFNFRMQREVAENLVFKRFWLEPVVKYKLQIALLLLGVHTPSQILIKLRGACWFQSMEILRRHFLISEKARQGKKYLSHYFLKSY